jgi:hypothetical protein
MVGPRPLVRVFCGARHGGTVGLVTRVEVLLLTGQLLAWLAFARW